MPDPSLTDALAEAAALAPADEVIHHTLEIRHPDFEDEDGNPTSIFIVQDTEDLTAPIEEGAPIKGGEWVTFVAFLFSLALLSTEPGVTAEAEITVDGIDRSVIAQIDRAIESGEPITIVYRVYLDTALDAGPQRIDKFELGDISISTTSLKAKIRAGLDLRGRFPRRIFTAAEFPGLVGR